MNKTEDHARNAAYHADRAIYHANRADRFGRISIILVCISLAFSLISLVIRFWSN